jgi:hypothetical protein
MSRSPIPIFYDDVPMSVRASMLFPADPEKARIVVGWAIARNLQSPTGRTEDDLVSTARDAAAFGKMTKEVGEQEEAGQAAGEVMKALFMMIAHGPHRRAASMEWAMQVVDGAVGKKANARHRTRLHAYVKLVRPVLHLWATLRLDEHRWPRTQDEADAFIERAEIVRQQLTIWDQGRPPLQRSPHLREMTAAPYAGWRPRGLRFYPPHLKSMPAKNLGRPRKGPST